MQVILDEKEYRVLWDRVFHEYGFDREQEAWLRPPLPYKKYRLAQLWTEEQERTVNSIFKALCPGKMYALDWQHDCMIFSPAEEIPLNFSFYDKERDCNVYFPSYFPNGDFYFFLSADWRLGLFGHPWRSEIYVVGDALTAAFDRIREQLALTEISLEKENPLCE